jgi:hypothetical protein
MKIYDEVWIMDNNKPTSKYIWGIRQTGVLIQDRDDDGYHYLIDGKETRIIYELIDKSDFKERFETASGLKNNWIMHVSSEDVFRTKDELIESLY